MGEKSTNTIALGSGITANTSGLSLTNLKNATAATFTAASAQGAMASIDTALNTLNGWRSDVGSTQNQLESALRNMMTQVTNIKAAESVVRDVDYAQESANFNKQNIVAQAGTYAMSQSNAIQQNVLRLLQ
jgi:flagellin